MAEQYQNPMGNIGYTDQDFQTAYPQLLNLAKELSDKWDPSQSNESDPGVVLIKEQAILDDKLHYSIDKNALETFPESVTQLQNARQIFEQGGYTMQWYVGATGQIYFRWLDTPVDDDENYVATTFGIEKFSMVCDEESNIVYTVLRDVEVDGDSTITEPVDVIQGTVHDYEVNGQTNITAQNLDEDYRLYFSDYNVAQNGIFVANAGGTSWDEWKMVDNLYTQPYGSKIYKFGILQDNSTCYIEFPEYIGDLIGSGLNIKYILTSGLDGNIKQNTLVKFFNGASATKRQTGTDTTEEVLLTTENISIIQQSSILTGYDPEGISSAYRNFKKTIGVFDTLVSLRDYNDYLNSEGVEADLLSNGFATDRTTDIQDSYYVVTKRNDVYVKKLMVEPSKISFVVLNSAPSQAATVSITGTNGGQESTESFSDTTDTRFPVNFDSVKEVTVGGTETNDYTVEYSDDKKIEPFQLKLYLLQYSGNLEYLSDIASLTSYYDQSFKFLNNILEDGNPYDENQYWDYIAVAGDENYALQDPALLEGVKCISHSFISPEANKILFLKNKYPLTMTVVPTQTLSTEQRNLMERNITKAICVTLNSKNISFGEQVDYDTIYDAIRACDNRIRNLYLDDITYITSAVYYDPDQQHEFDEGTGEVKEVEISDETDYVEGTFDLNGSTATNVVCTSKAGWNEKEQFVGTLLIGFDVGATTTETITGDETKTTFDITLPSGYKVVDEDGVIPTSGSVEVSTYSQTGTTLTVIFSSAPSGDVSLQIVCTASSPVIRKKQDGTWELYSNKRDEFRNEIYAKCVLAGNTQLLVPSDTFTTSLSQQMVGELIDNITKLEPNFDLYLGFGQAGNKNVSYSLKENEQIYLTAPNLITTQKIYGARYLCHLNQTVSMGTDHQLEQGEGGTDNEWVILIYKTDDKATNYSYTFFTYPTIFSADITLANTDGADAINVSINQQTGAKGTIDTNLVKNIRNYFTTSQGFYTKEVNSVYLIGNVQGKTPAQEKLYCYWFLNSKQDDKYVLPLNDTFDYTLKSGEQFIYTNSKFNTAVILSTGTTIHWEDSRWNGADPQLPSVPAISIEDFLFNGLNAIPKTSYYEAVNATNKKTQNLTVTENEVIALGVGDQITFAVTTNIVRNVKAESAGQTVYSVEVGMIGFDANKVDVVKGTTTLTEFQAAYDGEKMVTVTLSSGEGIDKGDTLTITVTNSIQNSGYTLTKTPAIIGSDGLQLTSLSYQFFGDSTQNELPINDGVRTWKIQTSYLLDMSQDKEQVLSRENANVGVDGTVVTISIPTGSENQLYASLDYAAYTKTAMNDDNPPKPEKVVDVIYPGKSPVETTAKLNLLSDIPVSTQGEEVVNTIQQTLSGSKNLALYQFISVQPQVPPGTADVVNNNDGTYEIGGTFGDGSTQVVVTIATKLPEGNYLIPYSPENCTVTATYSGTAILPISTQYKNFKVEVGSSSAGTFQFTIAGQSGSEWSVTIGNILCYTEQIDNFDAIVSEVAKYDTERIFDFTYQVEEDQLIENPLKADTFMNPVHPYNRYTICQANFTTSKYNILTNRGNR